ncbi:MAG: putative multidrug export ATP-binding/permease protein [Lentisphaerae bacterium ADurb.Bin242]|nr:MAG: putative multidrug export ATP-binding/permease protein [Lentisphaerae bacterium ADurb.Bin242]
MTEFKISGLLRQYKKMIIFSAITSIMFSSLALTMPLMLKVVIDRVLPSRDWGLFFLLVVIMIAIYTLRFTIRMITGYLGTYTVTRILLDVRQRIFKHLQSLSLRFYEEYRTGKLISNVISDVALLQGLITLCISMVDQFFTMAIITFAVFFINWKLALIAMCALPIHFLNFYIFNNIIRTNAKILQEKMSEISANLAETINGIRVVKSFSKERTECRLFFSSLRPTVELAVKMNQQGNVCNGIYESLIVMTYLIIIGCGIMMIGPDFTVGDFVAFYTYIGIQVGPIANLAAQMNSVSQGLAGAQRIMKILRVIPEIKDSPDAMIAGRFKGRIEFSHVSFKYADAPVLRDFSLVIEPGEKVALVGPSGCGKSTIGNLLLRFYDVTEGSIRIDGRDIRAFTQDSYRANIGVVLQEPFLFSGTIHDNLTYGRPNADAEDVQRAAEMANVEEFVRKLPQKYDTVIGENGASLSGGQKQRIAIARAVLKNPAILLLDEATSALDTVSEKFVQQALDTLMRDRTTVIIAHRLSTISNADKIVVLKDGKIDQLGTHDELMAVEGTYKSLYLTQQKTSAEGISPEGASPEGTSPEGISPENDSIFYKQHPKALEIERKARKKW